MNNKSNDIYGSSYIWDISLCGEDGSNAFETHLKTIKNWLKRMKKNIINKKINNLNELNVFVN